MSRSAPKCSAPSRSAVPAGVPPPPVTLHKLLLLRRQREHPHALPGCWPREATHTLLRPRLRRLLGGSERGRWRAGLGAVSLPRSLSRCPLAPPPTQQSLPFPYRTQQKSLIFASQAALPVPAAPRSRRRHQPHFWRTRSSPSLLHSVTFVLAAGAPHACAEPPKPLQSRCLLRTPPLSQVF